MFFFSAICFARGHGVSLMSVRLGIAGFPIILTVSGMCPSHRHKRSRRKTSAAAAFPQGPDNNWGVATLRESRRDGRAGAPGRCSRQPPEKPCARVRPARRRRCRSSIWRATPRPRWRPSTATERISASSSTRRDMMKPASLAPIIARCVSTCRSISRPSTSCSLQPRRNEAPCSAAIADESRALASDMAGSGREKRLPRNRSSTSQLHGILRMRIGRTEVQRLRWSACIGRGRAESRDPVDARCGALVDGVWRMFAGGP